MKARYSIEVLPSAESSLNKQLQWLSENRNSSAARELLARYFTVMENLEWNPKQWQRLPPPYHFIRKAILNKRLLLFYQVDERKKAIQVLAIRGAAEDWTNQPLPND